MLDSWDTNPLEKENTTLVVLALIELLFCPTCGYTNIFGFLKLVAEHYIEECSCSKLTFKIIVSRVFSFKSPVEEALLTSFVLLKTSYFHSLNAASA